MIPKGLPHLQNQMGGPDNQVLRANIIKQMTKIIGDNNDNQPNSRQNVRQSHLFTEGVNNNRSHVTPMNNHFNTQVPSPKYKKDKRGIITMINKSNVNPVCHTQQDDTSQMGLLPNMPQYPQYQQIGQISGPGIIGMHGAQPRNDFIIEK